MTKEKEKPHGYIYRATQVDNDKIYIGQTITSRWGENKNPIEERWKREVREAIRKHRVGEKLRNIEKAIIKYGSEKFNLRKQDKAYNQEELDAKERYWVKETDSMNPEKGYNMTEGGLGGKPSPEVLERLRERMNSPEYKQKISQSIKAKYDEDPEYYDKQAKERKERAKNPEFIEKMTKINQERAKNPEWLDKMANVNQEIARNPKYQERISDSITKKWQEQQYQDNVSKGATDKWQDAKHRERQFKSRVEGKREIPDKGQFLKDIQNMKKKEIISKYDMDGKSINVRIKEMLGHQGVINYSEAKKYLENKNLDEVLKDINVKLSEQPKEFTGKKVISNTRKFLEDIQDMRLNEITQKYNMNRSTVTQRIREMLGDKGIKNYTELKNYLQDKNLDDVVKEINERMKDQSHITEGKTIISDKKQFLEDIQEMQKNEIDQKYGMDAKTVNNKIKEMLGDYGVKNYTEAKEYLKDNNLEDVLKDIENKSDERQDRSSETTNEEQKEDKKQEEDNNEKQSEDQAEELNDKESDESDVKKPEEPSEESVEESTKKGEEREAESQETQSEESKEMEKTKEKERLSDMIGDTSNRGNKGKDKREWWDEYNRLIYTSGEEQDSRVQRSSKDYDDIDKSFDDRGSDYDGIDTHSEGDKCDIKSLDGGNDEQGNDYEGIDEPQDNVDKDYDKIDEGYGEGGYKG